MIQLLSSFAAESCLEYLYRGKHESGLYEIRPVKNQPSIQVYCDQDTGSGALVKIGQRSGGAGSRFVDKNFKVCNFPLPGLC